MASYHDNLDNLVLECHTTLILLEYEMTEVAVAITGALRHVEICTQLQSLSIISTSAVYSNKITLWHSILSSQAAAVSDEDGSPTGVLCIKVWPCHSASELTSHWLKVPERIKFKLAVLVYKCLHWRASQYLADELRQLADSTAQQHLCSASSTSHCPPYMTFNLIDYAFLTLLWRSMSLQPFIYCFLQSPKDFSLQVQRSTFTQYPHCHSVQK